MKPAPRIYVDTPLAAAAQVTLDEKQAHYLNGVMRLEQGGGLALFNGRDGEWHAEITAISKRSLTALCKRQSREQAASPDMMVCFAPPRGGRIDTIIEKATELGARSLQPVRTARSVVDKVNEEKWFATCREAAEQCERLDLPAIRPMVSLPQLLGAWDSARPLFYGDESGASAMLGVHSLQATDKGWAILTGPEGGFTAEEFALLARVKGAVGVALGPRILRTDTAVITLMALTQARFGDWQVRPHFKG